MMKQMLAGDGEEVEQIVRKKKKNRVIFYPTSEKIVWELGLVFANVREFREAVTKYAVQEKIQIEKYEIERRNVFWKIAKSTFEAELKDHIDAMKKLGSDCLDGL
ncbi:hypothetical protein H5410_008774 [Solanum commersonii]|uniref:Transposase MuDR plant domain-containing protein n=1 Tax=Solanum commersonii TaxID=4109 RepID=A0A9J6AGW6_SOLCO|nr:hypothetical protein H5410_008774 [Solanum commersonii]